MMGLAAMNLPLQEPARCPYGFGTVKSGDFATVVTQLTAALGERGYQVVASIDMQQVLEQGTGTLFPRYRVLCVCNPVVASRAFIAEPTVGAFFPCHIAVFEDYRQQVQIVVRDPLYIMDHLRHPAAIEAAITIKDQLETLIEAF